VHQIRFRPGLSPGSRWGSLQRSPRPLARLRGHTSKGKGGEKRRRRGWEGEEGRGAEVREDGPY